MIRTVVQDDLKVVQMDIRDEEISAMFDSGFFTAVLRQTDDGILEYADVNWEEYTIEWKEPKLKE
jgi:hypothetical protein